ncbi:cysteine--tRNA ligase [Streptosporangiaceae bacterium NEAU-GS5]|nr:cysteine--tRNA ligase [Streptosporangiaceae bacterium NEAU-GS5]
MLRLYDTRHRQVEPLTPAGARLLRMYTCGPAVDRPVHIADFRSYVFADLIRRVVERRGVRVSACRDITDLGESARLHEEAFTADAAALNLRPPEHAPRASESIEPMIELVAKLLEKGHAYRGPDGSVLFEAGSFPTYGEISGNEAEDWVLWKQADGSMNGATTWKTPWEGEGVPGWHVECSAMSLRFLGERIDLQTGGIDLRFPHHENERAQSDSATGHEVVAHWAHSEHVLFEGRRMAESAGNVVLMSDVAERGLDPLAVRLALLDHRYRHQMNLTWDGLGVADRTLRRFRQRVAEWAESPSRPISADYGQRIREAFEDDLDTPRAIQILRELERDPEVPAGAKFETFLDSDHILGLDLSADIGKPAVLPSGAGELLAERERAKAAHDWAAADRIRDELAALGVDVTDTPDGQLWSV